MGHSYNNVRSNSIMPLATINISDSLQLHMIVKINECRPMISWWGVIDRTSQTMVVEERIADDPSNSIEQQIHGCWKDSRMRGLGDLVAKMTKAVGIKPCEPCQRRQEALNSLIPFGNKENPDAPSQRPAGGAPGEKNNDQQAT